MPHVAWRDEKIRRLVAGRARTTRVLADVQRELELTRHQLEMAQQQLADHALPSVDPPSYRRYVQAERRVNAHLRELGQQDRGNLIAPKLKGYSFAQSHGVALPTIFGIWHRPEDITWEDLPDQVVIKTHTGSSRRGVFPLMRDGDRWTVVTTTEAVTSNQVVGLLRSERARGRVGWPVFAESLLGGGVGNSLPVDVKVHAFYGEIGHVLLRRTSRHGEKGTHMFRTVFEDGSDAGPIHWKHDPTIPTPDRLDEIVDLAKRLSRCVMRPFVRIDVYDLDGQIVFGEFTPRPGGSQDFGSEHDQRLGHLWERAHARLFSDVLDGADYQVRFGPRPRALRVGEGVFDPQSLIGTPDRVES
jgi:hypothetical protein